MLRLFKAMLDWTEAESIRIECIQAGKPKKNVYIERFNRAAGYEWPARHHWSSQQEVRDHATQWMWTYNDKRPNMTLRGITPKQRLAVAA